MRYSHSLLYLLSLTSAAVVLAQDCSATKPCPSGCCSKNGYCGFGPDYCKADNCVYNCDQKAECNPAKWEAGFAVNEKCPGNQCCSKWGNCGTTPEHCENQAAAGGSGSDTGAGAGEKEGSTKEPGAGSGGSIGDIGAIGGGGTGQSQGDSGDEGDGEGQDQSGSGSGSSQGGSGSNSGSGSGNNGDTGGDTPAFNDKCSADPSKRTIGYYEGWVANREGQGCQVKPSDIDATAYTHINYAFAVIDPSTYMIKMNDESEKSVYEDLATLRQKNPALKIYIAIGGWNFNDPGPTLHTFSELAADSKKQDTFFQSLVKFMKEHGFDGVDIDWEYPGGSDRGGSTADKANLTAWMKNMRAYFDRSNCQKYGITVTLPANKGRLDAGFDLATMLPFVEWYNIMTYDFYGPWDKSAGLAGHTAMKDVENSLNVVRGMGIPYEKIVIGLGFYGHNYKISDASCTKPGCGFSGAGSPGRCTAAAGTVSFAEITEILSGKGGDYGAVSTPQMGDGFMYFTYGDNWVGYDDANTIKMKLALAEKLCLGGRMVWAADQDTLEGTLTAVLKGGSGGGSYPSPPQDSGNSSSATISAISSPTGTGSAEGAESSNETVQGDSGVEPDVEDSNKTVQGGSGFEPDANNKTTQEQSNYPAVRRNRIKRNRHERFHKYRRSSGIHH